jgi:hypothetical protein
MLLDLARWQHSKSGGPEADSITLEAYGKTIPQE